MSPRLPHYDRFCRPPSVSRSAYSFEKTAPLDTGSEWMGEEDPPFHKKQEPAKSLRK
jgi:hypothetical protein